MKNVVWLTEWLPSYIDPYTGDGIERRAKAVSMYNDVFIIYVKKKPATGSGKVETEERVYNDHCRAIIYYYPSVKKISRLLDVIVSNYYFITLHRKALSDYRKKSGKPAGIQVNVTMKNGIIARYYKWLWGVRYIVVEGWSLFLPESKPKYSEMSRVFRWLTRSVLKHASLLVTVSDHLAKMMQKQVIAIPSITIPSVVDTNIFFPEAKKTKRNVFRFIHISSLNHPKNFEQVLAGFKMIIDKQYKAELIVHGPDRKEIKQLTASLGLQHLIQYKEETAQEMLAEAMREADALILYSRYETFGNVIIEANACGKPVIVSDYPTFSENVVDGVTGLVAKGNDPEALAVKMMYMMEHYFSFDPVTIARYAKDNYSFDAIAKRFDAVYKDVF